MTSAPNPPAPLTTAEAAAPPPPALQRPLLLAPAGDWDCARAAVENGADAIYFGLDRFNARMRAHNFTEADLPELMAFLHQRGVKGYVTVNTLVFTDELDEVERYLKSVIAAGVDAAIVQDGGLCRLIRHLSPDFPIHASTQMTVTSLAGIEFAQQLGCELVVLARETSIAELEKIQAQMAEQQISLPLEVFVHGALCVAYSGQCLTSEALGGRSANRGECAQACRMPYELVVDGETVDLGDRRYLLSPQDLSGLPMLPQLIQAGVSCLKIEGRLKAPEYVASVTRIYREALDRAMENIKGPIAGDRDRYELEMAFSRGLHSGWFEGIDNQRLVHGEYAKKRGVYLGQVKRIHQDSNPTISLGGPVAQRTVPLQPGDGIVFAGDYAQGQEQGGRVYSVEYRGQDCIVSFGRRDIDLRQIEPGDRLYKTSDPALEKQIRQTYAGEQPQFKRPIEIEVHGSLGENLVAIARDPSGHIAQVASAMLLDQAQNRPLNDETLQKQLGRLGNSAYELAALHNRLQGELMLPMSELNRMRRDLVVQLDGQRAQPKQWQLNEGAAWRGLLENPPSPSFPKGSLPQESLPQESLPKGSVGGELIVLVRNLDQLQATLETGIATIYCELEDPAKYKQAVAQVRHYQPLPDRPTPTLWLAPPRITKPKEQYILQQVRKADADGYLIRNYDQLQFFAADRCIGDFSLNIANPIAARHFQTHYNLERLTASYDLNAAQLEPLIRSCPNTSFEVTIHQHMPMFHMEHCVFCAFLSEGKDFRDCGRPCDKHEVKLRDRVGQEHPLQADAGCRNSLFNSAAQTGAEAVRLLQAAGLRHFRIEFLNESFDQVQLTLDRYQQLLNGSLEGWQLWQELKLQNQLGVTGGLTRGSLERT
ncbi:MAG: U32 family peptidase [Synechococcales cyanobacterium RM1_1_8]|nr:U32 family peptidase [Synechococcales cyanobacterium RM1_1_8]